MSDLTGIGAFGGGFGQGFSQGAMSGYLEKTKKERQQELLDWEREKFKYEQEQDVLKNIREDEKLSLQQKAQRYKELQEDRRFKMEESQFKYIQKKDQLNNIMKITNDWISSLHQLPEEDRQRFMKNYSNLPIFNDKNTPEWAKEFSIGMAEMNESQIKVISSGIKKIQEGQKNGDSNLIAQGYFEIAARIDTTKHPTLEKMLDEARSIIFPDVEKQQVSSFGKLISEQKKTEPGSYEDIMYKRMLEKEVTPSRGTTINVGMEKSTRGNLQKQYYKALDTYESLVAGKEKFTEEALDFLNIPGNLKGLFIEGQRLMDLDKIKDEKNYDKFVDARTYYLQTIAPYIHDLFGAAVTKIEEDRLTSLFPNISTKTGWERFLKTDSGKTFVQKYDTTMDYVKAIKDRLEYVLNNGGSMIADDEGRPVAVLDRNENRLSIDDFLQKENDQKTVEIEGQTFNRKQIFERYRKIYPEKSKDEIEFLTDQVMK